MINEAHRRPYDQALLITRDSDLTPAVRMLRSEFPTMDIKVIAPPERRHSQDLARVATRLAAIKPIHLERALMPQSICDVAGNEVAVRPTNYDPPA